jgi:hypothetical protein
LDRSARAGFSSVEASSHRKMLLFDKLRDEKEKRGRRCPCGLFPCWGFLAGDGFRERSATLRFF